MLSVPAFVNIGDRGAGSAVIPANFLTIIGEAFHGSWMAMKFHQGEEAAAGPLEALAHASGFSVDAVREMNRALVAGHGTMAQFSHPEFGGPGQWMAGGMTMVGDMFNSTLASRVNALCTALARIPQVQDAEAGTHTLTAGGPWWPGDLGQPSVRGAQNDIRYAWFRNAHRLAIDVHGNITVYDTGGHEILGVSQQQSSDFSLSFSTAAGTLDIAKLPKVNSAAQDLP